MPGESFYGCPAKKYNEDSQFSGFQSCRLGKQIRKLYTKVNSRLSFKYS